MHLVSCSDSLTTRQWGRWACIIWPPQRGIPCQGHSDFPLVITFSPSPVLPSNLRVIALSFLPGSPYFCTFSCKGKQWLNAVHSSDHRPNGPSFVNLEPGRGNPLFPLNPGFSAVVLLETTSLPVPQRVLGLCTEQRPGVPSFPELPGIVKLAGHKNGFACFLQPPDQTEWGSGWKEERMKSPPLPFPTPPKATSD